MSAIKAMLERLTGPGGECAIEVVGHEVAPADLVAHLAGRVASFKVPEEWEIRSDPLPRTPYGKVLEWALRDGVPEPAAEDSAL